MEPKDTVDDGVEYIAPCLTPAEHAAQIAAAVAAERDAAAQIADADAARFPDFSLQHAGEIMTGRRIAAAIRARSATPPQAKCRQGNCPKWPDCELQDRCDARSATP